LAFHFLLFSSFFFSPLPSFFSFHSFFLLFFSLPLSLPLFSPLMQFRRGSVRPGGATGEKAEVGGSARSGVGGTAHSARGRIRARQGGVRGEAALGSAGEAASELDDTGEVADGGATPTWWRAAAQLRHGSSSSSWRERANASHSSSLAQNRSIHRTPVASVAEHMCLADVAAAFFSSATGKFGVANGFPYTTTDSLITH
jgi:hypothetical protein